MKSKFALAVEGSTASFISKENLICDSALESALSLVKGDSCFVICLKSGYLSFGKKLIDLLQTNYIKVQSKIFECEPTSFSELQELLSKSEGLTVIVVGSEKIACFCQDYYKNSLVNLLFVAVNLSFRSFALNLISTKSKGVLILDEKLIAKCNRRDTAECVKSILAKRIIYAEIAFNRAIAPHFSAEKAEKLLDESFYYLQVYQTTRYLTPLVIACFKGVIAQHICGVEHLPFVAGKILEKTQNLAFDGEREYLIYKMLLRLYNFYFSNDLSFTIKQGGVACEQESIKNLFKGIDYNYSLPRYMYDVKEIDKIKNNLISDGKGIALVKEYLNLLSEDEVALRKEFGGKRYNVEHYNNKQRLTALTLAPYFIKKPCAYNLLFASGILEYFK